MTNCTKLESTQTKKHNSIAYHKVGESVAQETICIAKENGDTNLATHWAPIKGADSVHSLFINEK
jgi:hypothetical protein